MNVELLRRAAKQMRDERGDLVAGLTAGFWDSLADLLDEEAQGEENSLFDANHLAIAVARAYLGDES